MNPLGDFPGLRQPAVTVRPQLLVEWPAASARSGKTSDRGNHPSYGAPLFGLSPVKAVGKRPTGCISLTSYRYRPTRWAA